MSSQKNLSPENFINYSDAIEVNQPDEAKLIENIVASMGRMNRKVFDKHRHADKATSFL